MMRYRLYFFDRENRLAGLTEIHCDTDTEATEEAKKEAGGRRVEIWDEDRKVGVFGH
jgi:hypothetical protein